MVIIGAEGFAKEVMSTIIWNGSNTNELFFFDNVSEDLPELLFDKYPVIRSWEALKTHFKSHSREFILGVGGPKKRHLLAEYAIKAGGILRSIISDDTRIGPYDNKIGQGISFLAGSIMSSNISIGTGTLINKCVIIGHDSSIGEYCEISPGAKILGKVQIGNFTEIGANAVVLPGITIGDNCIVGAGVVVNRDYPANTAIVVAPSKGYPREFIRP